MTDRTGFSPDNLYTSSVLAWITNNGFVNENQVPIEFRNHRFMIDIYSDDSDDIVCRKSAQVGFSVFSILKSLHELKYERRNIIYALPTKNVVQDFVVPKVNPLISSNAAIKNDMGSDSVSLKKLADRFIYFKGGSEREAISVSADTLVIDEYDRMPDMNIVTMFDSRLQAAEKPRRRRFSNPSQVGFGVDGLYTDSDQMMWFVTCGHCGYKSYMDIAHESYEVGTTTRKTHYIDVERQIFACGKCQQLITDQDRRNGEWIPRYANKKRRGYWISQMMAPWVSAKRILEQKEEMDIATFHAFVLGKAYTPSDMLVDRSAILRASAPSNIEKTPVAIGVDQDAGGQYYVCMTPRGVFDYGYVDSWDKIEHLKLMYNAIVVCDPNPYQAIPKQLAKKYNDWYLCYFKSLDGLSSIMWKGKESVVYADRTRIIDIVANEIVNAKMLFRLTEHQLEEMIRHWANLYRTTEEKEDGRVKSVWVKKDGKQSDFPFAMTYARIGLSRVMGAESLFIEPTLPDKNKVTNIETNDGVTMTVDLTQNVADTLAELE